MTTETTFNNQTTITPNHKYQRILNKYFHHIYETSKDSISYSSIVKGDEVE